MISVVGFLLCVLGFVGAECPLEALMVEMKRILSKGRLLTARLNLLTRGLGNQTETLNELLQQDFGANLREVVGNVLLAVLKFVEVVPSRLNCTHCKPCTEVVTFF